MSNFELSYFETNRARTQLKTTGNNIKSLSSKLNSQANQLLFSSGMGVENMRSQMKVIAKKLDKQGYYMSLLTNYLDELDHLVTSSEQRAYQRLAGMTVNESNKKPSDRNNFWDSEWYKNLIKFLLTAIGPAYSAMGKDIPIAGWAIGIIETIFAGQTGGLTNMFKEMFSKLTKKIGKSSLSDIFKSKEAAGVLKETVGVGEFLKSSAIGAVVSWLFEWGLNIGDNIMNPNLSGKEKVYLSAGQFASGFLYTGAGFIGTAIIGAALGTVGVPIVAAACVGAAAGWGIKFILDNLWNKKYQNNDGFVKNVGQDFGNAISGFVESEPVQNALSAVKNVISKTSDFIFNPGNLICSWGAA